MKITFLGTGTSQGVPVIGGSKSKLDLSNPKNWRTRTSAHIEIAGFHIQIDASPEMRLQCLYNDITWVDLFILTHGHADHIAGMDDLRRFCDVIDDHVLPVYANDYGIERIQAMFPYALDSQPRSSGYPCFKVRKMPKVLELTDNARIYAMNLPHGPVETLGLIFEEGDKKIAYFTDCKKLSKEAIKLAKNADILAIDALRPKEHPSHLSVKEAIYYTDEINPKIAYFTHTTAHLDYGEWEPILPSPCHMAYDGLSVEI